MKNQVEMDNELEQFVVQLKPQRRFEKYYRKGYGTEHEFKLASLICMVRPQRILVVV